MPSFAKSASAGIVGAVRTGTSRPTAARDDAASRVPAKSCPPRPATRRRRPPRPRPATPSAVDGVRRDVAPGPPVQEGERADAGDQARQRGEQRERSRSGRASTATRPTRPNPATTTSPGHGERRDASPATAAASTMHHGHAGEQHELVVRAEGADGEVLELHRRQVDGAVADRQVRRRVGTDEPGDEVARRQRRRERQDAEEGGHPAAQPGCGDAGRRGGLLGR